MSFTAEPAACTPLTLAYEPVVPEDSELDSPAEVLAFVRAEQQVVRAAEARVFAAAVTWAHEHPPASISEAAGWDAGSSMRTAAEQAVPIAGQGAPLVAEFAIAELAAALGLSTIAGKTYLGHAVEVHHRLPHTRHLVHAGLLPVWRARRIAEHSTGLCEDGAAWLDQQIAPVATRVGPVTLDRLVTEALVRFEPERAEADAAAAAEGRHVTVRPLGAPGDTSPGVVLSGLSSLEAVLDGDDAADLETAVQLTAAHLTEQQRADHGDARVDPLDVRRSKALGIIARDQIQRHQETDPSADPPTTTGSSTDRRSSKQMVLHVHLSAAALEGCRCAGTSLARLEEGDHKVVLAETLRRWLGRRLATGEQIVVKPVIDLAEHHHVDAYEIPDRLHEQTELRDHHCVFPHCSRPARRCDCDHTVAHDRDGPTCSCNLAPLCRRHHRLKTLCGQGRGWTYIGLDLGSYLWRSPHSYQFLVDETGTRDVTPPHRQGRPLPPHPQPTARR